MWSAVVLDTVHLVAIKIEVKARSPGSVTSFVGSVVREQTSKNPKGPPELHRLDRKTFQLVERFDQRE
jgi:hypothetical protein